MKPNHIFTTPVVSCDRYQVHVVGPSKYVAVLYFEGGWAKSPEFQFASVAVLWAENHT